MKMSNVSRDYVKKPRSTHYEEKLEENHDMNPEIVTRACCHSSNSAPVASEEVSSDDEADVVADDNDSDDEVEVNKLRRINIQSIGVEFST